MAEMPSSNPQTWALSVELIRHIGLLLLPEEPCVNSPVKSTVNFHSPDFAENNRTLNALTYTCRTTRGLLEPLLFRFIFMSNTADITHYFLLFARNPGLRSFTRHIACLSSLQWIDEEIPAESRAWKIWKARCGPDATGQDVLEDAGFQLDYDLATEGNPKVVTNITQSFYYDGFLRFMFCCVLLMLPETDTLFFHQELVIEGTESIGGMFEAMKEEGYSVTPRLRVMELGTHEADQTSDLMELFFGDNGLWTNLETLVLNNTDFDNEFFQILEDGLFKASMSVQELYIRGPGAVLDPEWEITAVEQWAMMNLDHPPPHTAFCHLHLLDIDFSPSAIRARDGSRSLKMFISTIGGAPETLRLTRHPFPTAALSQAIHTRLKVLVLNECTDMPEAMSDGQMRTAVAALTRRGKFCLPNLEWIEVNGFRKGREELGL
ncbi:hypothetical protein B0J13DRAFT_673088 [Dactylonectria estremocensis]|uniref:Uncharacterized protein n=1 Tax=Dactylonectria estremocensis TaxID=1079267 RepID=A0A9P9F4D3_9HYPO|nr:hypothetical protein B0J13DRAFT_673088 [Dactylonectria estremocensis]